MMGRYEIETAWQALPAELKVHYILYAKILPLLGDDSTMTDGDDIWHILKESSDCLHGEIAL